ncbi:GRAS family protein [Longimicrobium terrae]|uniref:Histidine-specific methyltransferase SAM-dependent domain-containing protein n=1 Tax=Longimicrobium terrae TaxID=1639882 RepID=A0A841GUC8_9BACT|nr:GRAS family protein [Longimicrobium terrae]MBB4634162.1 hypothetical protein [Longimicrobium terrae]MBB6068948.1 hypothetical protein [Longimicrobium terrae]NNC28127.1 GAI protein [Longimicrobium terrae]
MTARKYATLIAVVQEHLAGRDADARALLADLVERQLDAGGADLQYYIFASALSRRLESDTREAINLYLRRFEQTQISLFNLLAQHLPTVSMAGPLANEVLADYLAGHEEATLLDVGIGSGRQEDALLRLMAARGTLPRRLNLIAVEPDAGSLLEASDTLGSTARELGIDLRFHAVHGVAEELSEGDWAWFGTLGAPMVVLGAFAVHHVRSARGTEAREDLFRRLRALNPEAVVLCEPSSDHNAGGLMERFQAAWHHFGLTFRLIDSLELGDGEKAAMKMFFAREIDDIVAGGDDSRCERHEPVDAWVRRLSDAGFAPAPGLDAYQGGQNAGVSVRAHDGYLGLDYGDETLVAILCATSAVPARTVVRQEQRKHQTA